MEKIQHRRKFLTDLWIQQTVHPAKTVEKFCKESLKMTKSLNKNSFQSKGNEYLIHKSNRKRYTKQNDINDFFNTRQELFSLKKELNSWKEYLRFKIVTAIVDLQVGKLDFKEKSDSIKQEQSKDKLNFVGLNSKTVVNEKKLIESYVKIENLEKEQKKDRALIKVLLEKNELMEQNICLIKNQNDSNEIELKEIQFSKVSNKQGINETRK